LTRLREENPDASLSDLLTFALREFDGEAADLRVAMADVRFIQQHIQRTGRPVGLPPGLV
jgi:hypothetical protein